VLQLQLGVPQAELGVDALTGLDAVEEPSLSANSRATTGVGVRLPDSMSET
jgi:hypothetical protein